MLLLIIGWVAKYGYRKYLIFTFEMMKPVLNVDEHIKQHIMVTYANKKVNKSGDIEPSCDSIVRIN